MSIANQDQADHWNSEDQGGHWVAYQARYDVMLAPYIDLILGAAELSSGDEVLDVGCGCGATTLAAARVVAPGHAVGVDLSAAMLSRARADAEQEGLDNVRFEQADVQVHPFEGAGMDAVISRFGIMFFADPVAAFANVLGATRPGGRLAFVCWQPLTANQWQLVPLGGLAEHLPPPDSAPGAPGMFAFADPEQVRRILGAAGWNEIAISSRHTPILVGGYGTLDDAVDFVRTGSMARAMLAGADAATAARALASVREALAPYAGDEGVRLDAAVWLVTARA